MSKAANDFMEKLFQNIDLIKPEDIPNIDLYMDQVTTLMENHLGKLKRFDEDKVLTKTMLNNYAKNNLLPAPEKKKYSKNHVLLLTFIYYLKSFLTIGDIKTLLSPLTDKYFYSQENITIEAIYRELLEKFPSIFEEFKQDIAEKENLADCCLNGAVKEDEYLRNLFFISLLGIDVYMKKQFIEAIIDSMAPPTAARDSKKTSKDKEARETGE